VILPRWPRWLMANGEYVFKVEGNGSAGERYNMNCEFLIKTNVLMY
jgi:hypothetical protein